jgi:hypothetical protein
MATVLRSRNQNTVRKYNTAGAIHISLLNVLVEWRGKKLV